MGFLDKITQSGQNVLNKAKDLTESNSIKGKVAEEQKLLKQHLSKLGEMYYQFFGDSPDERFLEICTQITESRNRINSLNSEIDGIKKAAVCPKCGAKNSDESAFCGSCGSQMVKALPAQKFCSGCGKQMPVEDVFCSNCGSKS